MATTFGTYQPSLAINQVMQVTGSLPVDGVDTGGLPVGSLRFYAAPAEIPTGAIALNGQSLSIASNLDLFGVLGSVFGGDGVLDFFVPDLGGNASIGTGQGSGLTNVGLGVHSGAATVTVDAVNLPTTAGGSGTPLDEDQPSLGMRYLIRVDGNYPSGLNHSTIGEVMRFAGSGVTPGGYLECDGSMLDPVTYSALFSLIGTTYGGDGTTTFALPDLRGRTVVGVGNGRTLGEQFGQEDVTLTTSNLPVEMGGSGHAIDNQEPSLVMNYLIALQGIYDGVDEQSETLGEITIFAGSLIPRGWAVCQGQLLSIAQNTALFSLLGTTYGGDGRTNFALPDLRGRSIVGADGSIPAGSTFGQIGFQVSMNDLPGLDYDGSGSNDNLYGANQDDAIDGLDGNDYIATWAGNDIVHGGSGHDYVTGGAGDDDLFGDDGNDRLLGRGGNDDLFGGADNDRLWGNGGLDNLTGNAGADRFYFQNASGGLDTITDFSIAEGDKLVVDASGFGGSLAGAVLDPARLVIDGAVDQAFGQFIYKSATGRLLWDADGTGAGRAYLVAMVQNGGTGVAGLSAGDFEIIA